MLTGMRFSDIGNLLLGGEIGTFFKISCLILGRTVLLFNLLEIKFN